MAIPNNTIEILIVDDTPDNLRVLSDVLKNAGYIVRTVTSGTLALRSIRKAPPDLILLDIVMPDMSGFDVCATIKQDAQFSNIPVIFLSALDDSENIVKAFQTGGVDYITKPFNLEEVMVRVSTQARLLQQQRQLTSQYQRNIEYLNHLNAIKSEVLNQASHDLKSPLGSVFMTLSMLKRHGRSDDEKGLEYISRVKFSVEHVLTLVTDLLDLAQIEAQFEVTFAPVNMIMCLENIITRFETTIESKKINFIFDYPPTLREFELYTNQAHLQRIIENLFSNALKYSDSGDTITIRVNLDDEHVIIVIEDTGKGIPEEHLPHIFDRFYRAQDNDNQTIDGTGLGLHIVKQSITRIGGQIDVESEIGVGTKFIISIPNI